MIIVVMKHPQGGPVQFMAEGGDPASVRSALVGVIEQIDEQYPDLAAPDAVRKPTPPKSNLLLPPHLLPPNGR